MGKIIIVTLTLLALMLFTNAVLAESLWQNLESAGGGAGYNPTQNNPDTIPNTIGQIVALVLSFVGSIFLILTIFSGLQWMTAGGNEEKVKQARTRLINSVMGLAITTAAYFITYLIRITLLG